MKFWPDDINAEECDSPRDIMQLAGDELANRTGRLVVSIVESQLEDRTVLAFEVTNSAFALELYLFEVSHRLDQAYPVAIEPPASDIPEFLKKERYVAGTPGVLKHLPTSVMMESFQGRPGRYVTNSWVCATPTEFKA